MESDFQDVAGVEDVISGFTGGTLKNPTYKGNHDGHYEAIKVNYDPSVISFQDLLDLYWVSVDPLDDQGQFCDRGPSYRAAIFYLNPQQQMLAQSSKSRVIEQLKGESVMTQVLAATEFWPVEEHHQNYYKKNPIRYKYYRYRCGRDARLTDIWGDAATAH